MFFWPISGNRKLPTCATRDIAAAAAKLLLDPTWSGQDRVPILGPEDLSFNDMAQIMSQVLGKPVRFEQVSFEAFRAGFIERGASEAFAQAMVDMLEAKNEGLDNAEPRTPQSTTPTSFRQWCEEVLKPAVAS
ncbi:NmrA family NAD(P)-binding protein [Mesorhizobium sp. ISC15]